MIYVWVTSVENEIFFKLSASKVTYFKLSASKMNFL